MGSPVTLPADTPRFATRSTAPRKSSSPEQESLVDLIRAVERRAFVLADNKLALNAGWDEDLLAEELGVLLSEDLDFDIWSSPGLVDGYGLGDSSPSAAVLS